MVTTNSKELFDKLLLLRTHGISKENMDENHGDWYYEMKDLGYNYRLTDFQSALGITQLAKNKDGLKRRNEIANNYKQAFRGKIKFQHISKNKYNAYHLFVIEVDDRKGLYDFLRSENIYSQIHYIPIHILPYYKRIDYSDANLNCAESYYSRCISLPMYPTLTSEEQSLVISNVIKFIFDEK